MTISGLTLFKLLPGGKKQADANCKKCGFPTCMAYAMKLAKGDTTLNKCPHASNDLKDLLEQSGGKVQALVCFGLKSDPVKAGGENVLYRHCKTFINPTCLSIHLKTSQRIDFLNSIIDKIYHYQVERVGELLKINSIALHNDNNDLESFDNLLTQIINKKLTEKLSVILISNCINDLLEASKQLSNHQRPLLYLKNGTTEQYRKLLNTTNCPICIEAEKIEDLVKMVEKLEKDNFDQIVLAIPEECKRNILETLTLIRRSVIENNHKQLRFPVLTIASDYYKDADCIEEGIISGNLIAKYSNIVLLNYFDPAVIYSLLTLRQNLFTDPQKPLQIEPKLYTFGDVDECSPVIVTTNFALTYFSVAGEIEASNLPCYLLITNSDGMSVLTAWAANKFSGEVISKAVKEFQLEQKIKHRNLIISGYVSMLKEEIEEELSGWKVDVAPLEAVEIPEFLKNYKITCHQT